MLIGLIFKSDAEVNILAQLGACGGTHCILSSLVIFYSRLNFLYYRVLSINWVGGSRDTIQNSKTYLVAKAFSITELASTPKPDNLIPPNLAKHPHYKYES